MADDAIEAVYVPLPPALHFEWGRKVLEAGKHLLMEKPFTTDPADTATLLELAKTKNLAVHENYMFLYHSQLAKVRELIKSGELGELRLVQTCFGFPRRSAGDFRYSKDMGGGALLDCGGYPIRLGYELLGESCRIVHARLCLVDWCDADVYGSVLLENDEGLCAQIGFGMDNAYQCRLEVWGSKATLIAPRIFTAGVDVAPEIILRTSSGEKKLTLEKDDQFLHSIEQFWEQVSEANEREANEKRIMQQAMCVQEVREREVQ